MSSSLPCTSCLFGSVHSGAPVGVEETIHGLPTYIASPPEGTTPRGLVVMIPDAFGWAMVNNRLLCDAYAKKGGLVVYLPDFIGGYALPVSSLGLAAEITTPSSWTHTLLVKPILLARAIVTSLPPIFHIRASQCRPRIIAFLQALRSEPLPAPFSPSCTDSLKVGIAAFCWGGQHAFFLAQDLPETRVHRHNAVAKEGKEEEKQPLVDAIFTAHPSLVRVPVDVENVKLPVSVCIGTEDTWMKTRDIATMEEILEMKSAGVEKEATGEAERNCECVLLQGAKHGFAVRSWEGDEIQMGFAQTAEEQALKWFERWLI